MKIGIVGRFGQGKTTLIRQVFGVDIRNEKQLTCNESTTTQVTEYTLNNMTIVDTPAMTTKLGSTQIYGVGWDIDQNFDAYIIVINCHDRGDSLDRDFVAKYCKNKPFLICFTKIDNANHNNLNNLSAFLNDLVLMTIGDRYDLKDKIVAGRTAWLTSLKPRADRLHFVENNPMIKTGEDILDWIDRLVSV